MLRYCNKLNNTRTYKNVKRKVLAFKCFLTSPQFSVCSVFFLKTSEVHCIYNVFSVCFLAQLALICRFFRPSGTFHSLGGGHTKLIFCYLWHREPFRIILLVCIHFWYEYKLVFLLFVWLLRFSAICNLFTIDLHSTLFVYFVML